MDGLPVGSPPLLSFCRYRSHSLFFSLSLRLSVSFPGREVAVQRNMFPIWGAGFFCRQAIECKFALQFFWLMWSGKGRKSACCACKTLVVKFPFSRPHFVASESFVSVLAYMFVCFIHRDGTRLCRLLGRPSSDVMIGVSFLFSSFLSFPFSS